MIAEMEAVTEDDTAATCAGAASHETEEWYQIDWRHAHRIVRRLQARIVQATQEGRWGKVKALQHLLTHSRSAKVLAVRRVTENHGKHTPGVDRIVWDTPGKKMQAVRALQQRGYQPRPLRRTYVPKSNGKMRPLGIATMADRAMQTVYLCALAPIAEVTGDRNSYGFRRERATADAMAQCFTVLSQKTAAQWVFEGDICACFDRMSHAWLEAHVPMDTGILHKWLKAGFMEKHVLQRTEEGAAQGGPLSPVLANLALDGLERRLRERFPKPKFGHSAKVNFVRFADDFIITGISKEILETQVRPLVKEFMSERGLALSPEKTVITHIADGFDFLGQHVRKNQRGTLLITPSSKNVHTFLDKVRKIVKDNKQATAGHLIQQLNPLIRGWALYHRHVVSKKTFAAVDAAIFRMLWRWAKRRHPQKNLQWIRGTYFRSQGARNWVFAGQTATAAGQMRDNWLFYAAQMPIRRHTKVREEANPYDPAWEVYFERRLGVAMAHTLVGRNTLLHLWKEQNGACPVCRQKITTLTGWHSHHIVWRSKGGGDGAENRVLLHPTCHSMVHSQGLSVVKPRPARGVQEA